MNVRHLNEYTLGSETYNNLFNNHNIDNSIVEDAELTDESMLKLEQEAIANVDTGKSTREKEEEEFNLNVPELTESNLSRRTKERFKGGKLSFYH